MATDSTLRYGDHSLIIATGNPGKRREFEALLDDFLLPKWEIFDRQSFPKTLAAVEETGSTFRENAIKKAMETASQTGCCALSDDSGLEVDALHGAPGVRSARFAGDEATDEDNNKALIAKLEGVSEPQRTARFVSVVCLAMPENRVARQLLARRGLIRSEVESAAPRNEASLVGVGDQAMVWFRGTVEGIITTEPAGDEGFGYDPYFFVPQMDMTMAQLSMEEKNSVSHRAKAVAKLVEFFE